MFLPSDFYSEHQNELVTMELPSTVLTSQIKYTAEIFQALWLAVLAAVGSWNNNLPSVFRPNLGKSK